jgi:FHS family L-fucose permease-like MFS transporter
MSLPAGWLAIRLGYKGGIIAGLLLVACGGFWFIPATHIAQFWAFLLGVCMIASGLTFLETVANPYTTVLGPKEFAATRINLAQSCNGVGWFFGPIAGAMFFYSKDAAGNSTGSQTLWIPYTAVAVIVVALAAAFYFAPVPDIKTADEYHLDDTVGETSAERRLPRGLIYFLLLCNVAVLVGILAMILWVILDTFKVSPATMETTLWAVGLVGVAAAGFALVPTARNISHHSIWSHPHFSGATLAQFF